MQRVHDGPWKPDGGISSLHVLRMSISVSHATYGVLFCDALHVCVLIVSTWQDIGWFWYTAFLFGSHASLPLSYCLLIRVEKYPFCCLERDDLIAHSLAIPYLPAFYILIWMPRVADGPWKPHGGTRILHVLWMSVRHMQLTVYCLRSMASSVLIVRTWHKKGRLWHTSFLFGRHVSLPLSAC